MINRPFFFLLFKVQYLYSSCHKVQPLSASHTHWTPTKEGLVSLAPKQAEGSASIALPISHPAKEGLESLAPKKAEGSSYKIQ